MLYDRKCQAPKQNLFEPAIQNLHLSVLCRDLKNHTVDNIVSRVIILMDIQATIELYPASSVLLDRSHGIRRDNISDLRKR